MWEAILAGMLFLLAPGKSMYSQVVVPQDAPAPCAATNNFLCSPPQWSEAHQGYTVAETYQQGLQRYATIALAAEQVVSLEKWSSPRGELWRYLITMVYAESGFRRDVHEGKGKASRGDCRWRKVKRKKRDGTVEEVAERIPGSCKSHCLAQIQIGPLYSKAKTTVEGYGPLDLIGTDLAATKRCFEVAVRALDGGYHWCRRWGPRPLAACVINRYGGGMLKMDDKRIKERIRWLNKLHHAPDKLTEDVRSALGLEPEEDVEGSPPEREIVARK